MKVDPDRFLNELHRMFERQESAGSVFVTMKRTNEKPKTKANWDAVPYGCLVRATDGKKKVSTLLGPKDVLRFQDAYDTILKAKMDALKDKPRSSRKA